MELLVSACGLLLKMARLLALLILLRVLGVLYNYRVTERTGLSGVLHGPIITVVVVVERILVRALMLLCHYRHNQNQDRTTYLVRLPRLPG